MRIHENFDRDDDVALSSERGFGFVFAIFFALVGAVRWWVAGAPGLWFIAAAVFACLALFWTAPLAPLNRLWHRLAVRLYAVVNPLVMAMLFAVTIIPIGLLLRARGKDLLRLRREPDAKTYWIPREHGGTDPDTMRNQF